MFRRFMIVCWVLFAIVAIASLAGLVGEWHYLSQSKSIVADTNMEIRREIEAGIEPDNPWDHDEVIATPESENAYYRSRAYGELASFAGIPAVLVFLWNIIWHVGHWIWMGRE